MTVAAITAVATILLFMLFPPTVHAFSSDLRYEYRTEGETEFYNTGIQNLNYDGAIPDYLQNIYNITPQHPYGSDYGANIIVPDGMDTMTNEAARKAPANAPVSSVVNAQPIQTTNSGIGVSQAQSTPRNNEFVVQTIQQSIPNETESDYYLNYWENINDEKQQYPITSIEKVRESNGKIGILKIPKIGLTVNAYDGDTFSAMQKGIGHIASTSAWMGNIGLVGHNRGTNDYFGKLKTLKIGDELTYETRLANEHTWLIL